MTLKPLLKYQITYSESKSLAAAITSMKCVSGNEGKFTVNKQTKWIAIHRLSH